MRKLNYEKIYFYIFVKHLEANPFILSLSNPLNFIYNDYGIYNFYGNLSNVSGMVTFKGEMGVSYQFIDFIFNLSDELYNEICLFYKKNHSKYYVSLDVIVKYNTDLSVYDTLYYVDDFVYYIDFSNRILYHYNEDDTLNLSLAMLGFNDLYNSHSSYLFNTSISNILISDYLECLNNGLLFSNDIFFIDVGLDLYSLYTLLESSYDCGEKDLILCLNSKCYSIKHLLSLSEMCNRSNIVLCLLDCGKHYTNSLIKNKHLLESSFKSICYKERN